MSKYHVLFIVINFAIYIIKSVNHLVFVRNKNLLNVVLNKIKKSGNFTISKFDYLTTNELDFVERFLKEQGNFITIQNENGMSYSAVKKKFNDILGKLKLSTLQTEERVDNIMISTGTQLIKITDSLVVKRIKEKLNANNGQSSIKLYNGDAYVNDYDPNGRGLILPRIPPANQLTRDAFDTAVEIVINNGGKVIKEKQDQVPNLVVMPCLSIQ